MLFSEKTLEAYAALRELVEELEFEYSDLLSNYDDCDDDCDITYMIDEL